MRAGVDIGGTFTDVVLETGSGLVTTKVLTDYATPERAILAGLAEVSREAGADPGEITQIIHGTTLVTNALIERRGARTAFVTTEGFRDVIEMRTESRFEQYDLNLRLPEPLVAREDRLTLAERVAADGSVLKPVDPADLDTLVERIRERGYKAVAVGLIHAYANPAHERAVAEALSGIEGLSVSLSSRVAPQMREYERFNTVVANAYVQPRMAAYLNRLTAALRDAGIAAPVYLMHSGGGLIGLETAAAEPVRLLESGPAGGAIFAAGFARARGLDRVMSFDMGGTTAKICLVEDGRPRTAASFEVARSYRFKKGSGMPVLTPVVEMVEIGAGGGSIASVDALGRIAVGPRSAGSEPGPACYGRGGTEATVSDANLTLGRLDPDRFAGGKIALDPDAARAAIARSVPEMDVEDGAHGIAEIVDENMANAARVHTVEHGRDVEAFTMIAFGGGAPLHACRLADKLGIDRILVPRGAGVGSAIGFLRAPFSYEASRGLFQRLDRFDAETVNQTLSDMRAEASQFLAGADRGDTEERLILHMRYAGQGWEIPVTPSVTNFTADTTSLRAAFEAAYRDLFGRVIEGLAVEVTNWSLTLSSPRPPVARVRETPAKRAAKPAGKRMMFDPGCRAWIEAPVVMRTDLSPGDYVDGPAVIAEDETATVINAGFRMIAQDDGCLLLERDPR